MALPLSSQHSISPPRIMPAVIRHAAPAPAGLRTVAAPPLREDTLQLRDFVPAITIRDAAATLVSQNNARVLSGPPQPTHQSESLMAEGLVSVIAATRFARRDMAAKINVTRRAAERFIADRFKDR